MENIKKLVKLANSLDQKGYHVEADLLDSIINKMAQDESKTIDKYILKTKGDPFQYFFEENKPYFTVHSIDPARANEKAKSGGTFSDAVGKRIEKNTPAFNNLLDRIYNLTGTQSEVIPVYDDGRRGSPLPQGYFSGQEAYVAPTEEIEEPLAEPTQEEAMTLLDEEYFEKLLSNSSMERLEPSDVLYFVNRYLDLNQGKKAYDLANKYVNLWNYDSGARFYPPQSEGYFRTQNDYILQIQEIAHALEHEYD